MGKIFQIVVLLISIVAIYYSIYRTKQGKIPYIRTIACLEVLEELVGRAAEMGSPIHMITGTTTLSGSEASITTAGYAFLGYIAELCGKYKVYLRYSMSGALYIPIAQDLIKTGYAKGGAPELYVEDMCYYVGQGQSQLIAEVMGYITKTKPAISLMFGGIKYEALNVLGAAAVAGCIQAAGTPRLYYQPFLAACCDYSMIGDEMYAAIASFTDKVEERGVILGQDVIKLVALILIIAQFILYTTGAGDLFHNLVTL